MAKTILAVFAHPDDEVGIGGFLARAKATDMNIHLICATRGEASRIRHPEFVTAENQADIRSRELEKSCETLGISSLNFLDLPDGGAENWYCKNLEEKLLQLFIEIKPDIVITFDTNGSNGHKDHKEISRLTTVVFNCYKSSNSEKLYYTTLFPETFIKRRLWLLPIPRSFKDKIKNKFTTSDDKVTGIIKLNKKELNKKISHLDCHKSQFPDENGKYFKVPYSMFKRFAVYECYYLCGYGDENTNKRYKIVDKL